jgi:Uma2 family endonuclease
MAIGTTISVEEYLRTSYRPDCDYVDGELRERNLGEFDHSSTQVRIVVFLCNHYLLRARVLSEQRVQVKPGRFRIPDVCILRADAPKEQIVKTAPSLCIEILSRDDSMRRIMERIDDYFEMGVPVCWIVDPVRRRGWIATPGHRAEAADGVLRTDEFEMPFSEVLPPAE